LDPGTRLGSFEVLGPLGAGGMGEVYRAIDTRLGREVAIKILPAEFAQDEGRLVRFEREARLLASLNHPGLAAIYGLEQSGPWRYIVMELVPGQTLSEKLASGALSIPEALGLARQIAEALEAAHEKGIVHRDLKPSNIKVTPEGKVKVLDLGLAKAMDLKTDPSDTNSPTVVLEQTRPGVILGTAEFMSPEQARGRTLDKRSDIWSYGCVFFEMLSGRRPFTGETISDIIASILASEPDWALLPAATPRRIRELIRRCLEKDLSQRLRDIGDARLEIDTVLSGGKDSAPIPSDARPFSVGRRAAAVFAAVLAGAGAWWVFTHRSLPGTSAPSPTSAGATTSSRRSLAVLPFRDISSPSGNTFLGDGIVETVSARLGRVPGVQVVTPAPGAALASHASDPFLLARDYGADLFLVGAIQHEKDRVRITYAVWDRRDRTQITGGDVTGPSSSLFSIQDELTDRVCKELNLARAAAAPPSGLTGQQQERYVEALGALLRWDQADSIDHAVSVLDALAAEAPASALAHAALARAQLKKYEVSHDAAWAQRAAAECDRAAALDAALPQVHVTRGALLARTGHPGEAVGEYEKALAQEPNLIEAMLGLANAQRAAGRAADAEKTYRRAIALQPNLWIAYNGLGRLYYDQGRYGDAATAYREVVRLTPDNIRGYNNLGATLQQLDELDRAFEAYETSARLNPSDANTQSNLGTLHYFLRRYPEAAACFERATAITPNKSLYWTNLGDAYLRAPGLAGRAPAAYDRAAERARAEIAVDPRDAAAHATLALALARKGDARAAREEVRRSVDLGPKDPENLYQAAVVAALAGEKEEAAQWVRKAIEGGMSVAQVRREPEFDRLREVPVFQRAIAAGKTA
ncbi:MAG: protein kinase, partial [Acidobacteriota bacterium]